MGTQWMPSARRDSRAWTKNPMSRNTGSLRVIAAYPGSPEIQRELLAYMVGAPTDGRVCPDCGVRHTPPSAQSGTVCNRCKHARERRVT